MGPSTQNYQLSLSGFTGITPNDPFADHILSGHPFSTYNRSNDRDRNCAINGNGSTAPGGWWHYNCFYINLNYNYRGPLGFIRLARRWYNPPFIEMKIHPSNCKI